MTALSRLKSFILILLVIGAFYGPFVSAEAQNQCQKLSLSGVATECHLRFFSPALKGSSTLVKAWVPHSVNSETPVILFFHGRGYAHDATSHTPTMIEAAGLKEWMNSESYQKNLTHRKDGTGKGNDYWIGAEGRDWESFITQDLKPSIEKSFGLRKKQWLAAGISMGAHGAMKMALDHPAEFKAFASISPVFRSSIQEINGPDKEVFFQTGNLSDLSVGARLLTHQQPWSSLQKIPHWVDIHQNDFALGDDFQDSRKVWEKLLITAPQNPLSHVEIVTDDLKAPGHSMVYWQKRLPKALDWLIQIETLQQQSH
jgi:pimeloyl-ACP methyl ester carboxylesterase